MRFSVNHAKHKPVKQNQGRPLVQGTFEQTKKMTKNHGDNFEFLAGAWGLNYGELTVVLIFCTLYETNTCVGLFFLELVHMF